MTDIATPAVAIILPSYNEEGNITPLVAEIRGVLGNLPHEIIVVDDWSRDGTVSEVRGLMAGDRSVRLIRRYGRRGLATAVVEGMMATDAPILAVMDADGQHDPAILPCLIEAVRSGACDVAIGSRYVAEGSTGDWDESRVKASQLATTITHKLLKVQVSDPMSGYFAVRRDVVEEAVPRLSAGGFKILLDLLTASPKPLRTREIGFTFRSRTLGESKLDSGVMLDFAQLIARRIIRTSAPARFVLFGFVGGLGLIIHLATLRAGLNLLYLEFSLAQALAVLVAIAFNYSLNNRITFADRRRRGRDWWKGLASFYLVCGTGAVANVGLGSWVFAMNHQWALAGVAGAIVGSIWNFAVSTLVTWRKA